MRGNGSGKCSGMVVMSLRGGTKGGYRHVNIQIGNETKKEC